VKYHTGRNKAIKILNTKIPTDSYKTAIFPVGISLLPTKIPTVGIFSYEWQAGFPQLFPRNSLKLSLKFPKSHKNSLDFAQISIFNIAFIYL